MFRIQNVHPLSDFQRKTKEFVSSLKESKEPLVLTINGKPELVVIDALEYERMMEALEEAEVADILRHRTASDKTVSVAEAFDGLAERAQRRTSTR